MENPNEGSRSQKKKIAIVSLASAALLAGAVMTSHNASANAVNDYIKQGITQKGWKAANEENRLGGIKYKYAYNNGVGHPTMVINHDTANPNSNIDGEIAYMTRNQEAAFVHEFVDGNRMIGIADTDYLAWGAGPQGNGRGVQVEQVHVHSKDDFARELINLAQFNVNIMKQYKLTPSLGQPNGSGSVWTHAMVSRYLGGSDHADPDGYWSQNASQWFGTTYNVNDFESLVNDMYYGRLQQATTPANVTATTKVRQDGGNFIADVTVSGDTSRITEVQVPTWTDAKQKDLKWYVANKINANTYRVVIPTSNHQSTGNYIFHTYVRTNDGKFTFKNSNSLKYITNGVTAQTTHSVVNGKLLIRTTFAGEVGRLSKVEVPTWTDPNQKDIKWYPMVKKSNNTYEYVYDNLKNLNYGTLINTHVYATSDGWQRKAVSNNGFSYNAPVIKGSTKVEVKGSNIEVTSHLDGETGRIDHVEFPTWHDKNQKDLKWYRATKVSATDYKVTIPLKDYNNAKGDYITHSYIVTTEGKRTAYAANNYTVGVPAPAQPSSVVVSKTQTTDQVGVVRSTNVDVNMYTGNPPLTQNGGNVVAKTATRNGQTFRMLRESTLSNGKTYAYGLFGDNQYVWMIKDSLTGLTKTPVIKSDGSLKATPTYGTITNTASDIRKGDPRYRVASQYKNYTDVINSNSAKSANVQLTRKTVYDNGETWYEFTQSNKNGVAMGWVNAKFVGNIK